MAEKFMGVTAGASEVQEKNLIHSDELIKAMKEAGANMFFKRLGQFPCKTMMFPPCPASQYIDRFPSGSKSKAEVRTAKQQAQYEGEIKIFHAIEKLRLGLFVMHSLKYTHLQYNLFVEHQCKRKDSEEEGEADFILVRGNSIVILEVKAIELSKENSRKVCERNYKKSNEQLEKTSQLVRNICDRQGLAEKHIYQFTIFTNIDKEAASKLSTFSKLNDKQKQEIIFMDDMELNVLRKCFHLPKNDVRTISEKDYCQMGVLYTLLGLWCADPNNEFSQDKWELGRVINRIDNLLKSASITNQPEGPNSSLIKGSPADLKKLGILCLTEEQKRIYKSEDHRMVINGSAGSGKTVLILGKIIQLMKKSQGHVIVIVSSDFIGDWYEENLSKSGISSIRGCNKNESDSSNREKVNILVLEDYGFNSLGMVEEWAFCRLFMLNEVFQMDAHIFIDDFHSFDFALKYYPYCLFAVLGDNTQNAWEYIMSQLNKNSQKVLWICYDTLQSTLHTCTNLNRGNIDEWESKVVIHKLSANLRNSHETANFIQFIRDERLRNIQESFNEANEWTERNFHHSYKPFDVKQSIGHFIHGPTPRIYCVDVHGNVEKKTELYLTHILCSELASILSCEKVALIHDDYGDPIKRYEETDFLLQEGSYQLRQNLEKLAAMDTLRLNEVCQKAKERIHKLHKDCEMDLKILHMDEVVSAEWPAVIGIIKYHEKFNIALDLIHNKMVDHYWNEVKKKPFLYLVDGKQNPMDRFLAKLNAIVSRGRSYCVIICVIDGKEPLFTIRNDDVLDDKAINAKMFEKLGSKFIKMSTFGEAEHGGSDYKPIDFTLKQVEDMIHNMRFSIEEKNSHATVRFPSGKVMSPKEFTEKIAIFHNLQLNYRGQRDIRKLEFDDKQIATLAENTKNELWKESLKMFLSRCLNYSITARVPFSDKSLDFEKFRHLTQVQTMLSKQRVRDDIIGTHFDNNEFQQIFARQKVMNLSPDEHSELFEQTLIMLSDQK